MARRRAAAPVWNWSVGNFWRVSSRVSAAAARQPTPKPRLSCSVTWPATVWPGLTQAEPALNNSRSDLLCLFVFDRFAVLDLRFALELLVVLVADGQADAL